MTDIALVDLGALGLPNSEEFALVSTAGGAYLPRLQLGGSTSDAVKQRKVQMGNHYLVENDTPTDLGSSVDVIVLGWMSKALDVSGAKPISNFDVHSEGFKKIQAKSAVKDSNCMYGPSYLVYIPSVGKFAEYFMSSKTARKESKNMQARLGMAATLSSELIETTEYSWFGPIIRPCSTPITPPSSADIVSANEKFQAQKQQVVETVAPASDRKR
jgi:hypothetical protein